MSNSKANFIRTAVVFFIYFIALSFSYPANSTAKQDDYWPTKGWKTSTPEAQGMDSNLLANMLENIKKEGGSVDSITIVRNGVIVFDVYFHGPKRDSLHIIHSCTKSIMSLLIGIAIDLGYIKDIHRPVISFFPEKRFANLDERKKAMTLEHLLIMAPGLQCRDSWKYEWEGLEEMRYSYSDDWIQYMLDLPMVEAPGTRFEYCNGASFLLSAIIQKVTGMKTFEFARKHLFKPLGITDAKWNTNPQGITIGWGEMWLKPQDMAKIGYLCLKQGQWEDRQIVSKDWMKTSTRKHIDTNMLTLQGYGYQWWILPTGSYTALGYNGQYICIIPQKNLVVVFTSENIGDTSTSAPRKLLKAYIKPAVKSDTALPSDPEARLRLNTLLNKYANSI